MQNNKAASMCGEQALVQTESIFAKRGIDIVRSGMLLILDRLRFAKKHDAKIREAICAIDGDSELKAAQAKALIEALRRANVMSTSEVLALVTDVIERLGGEKNTGATQECDEVLVTLDERVEKWAQ